MRIIQIIAVYLLCSCLFTLPSANAQSNRNESNKAITHSLLKDLEEIIEEADKRMVAHPTFLDELRDLIAKYKKQLRNVFFFDNFSDGDYTKNPEWNIRNGEFLITSDGKLKSTVNLDLPPASASPSDEKSSLDKLFSSLFGDDDEEEVESADQETKKKRDAVIESLVKIGSAFEVDLSFIAESTNGVMEIILLGGKENSPLYRLKYPHSLEKDLPIRIIRVGKKEKRRVIETETLSIIADDGGPHILQWILNEKGTMEVLVDGKQILSTKEQFFQDDFTGIRLVNRSGTYKWGPIKILEPPF